MDSDIKKIYYSTREVAAMFGISRYVLYNWCAMFTLEPHFKVKGSNRIRRWSLHDITKIRYIVTLKRKGLKHTGIAELISVRGWPSEKEVKDLVNTPLNKLWKK